MTWLRRHGTVFLGWVPFLAAMALLGLSGDPNLVHVATLVAIWSLWGTSLNIIWGYAGQLSMAQVGLGAVSAYTASLAVTQWHVNGWMALSLGVGVAVAASLVIGLASLRLSGFYFAIMTLAFALLFLSFVNSTDALGRSSGASARFELGTLDLFGLQWELNGRDGGYLALVVVFACLALLVVGRMERTRTGRAFVALREDPVLASSIGVRATSYRLIAFVGSAVPAALAGFFYAGYLRFITPSFFGFSLLIVLIVQLVVGGRGRQFGPVVGAAIYVALTEMTRFGGDYREATFGLALILIVIFAPQGVIGAFSAFRDGWRRRWRIDRATAPTAPEEGPMPMIATTSGRDGRGM